MLGFNRTGTLLTPSTHFILMLSIQRVFGAVFTEGRRGWRVRVGLRPIALLC